MITLATFQVESPFQLSALVSSIASVCALLINYIYNTLGVSTVSRASLVFASIYPRSRVL